MSEFEETFIYDLAVTRATAMLKRGLSTIPAYSTPGTHRERILNLIG